MRSFGLFMRICRPAGRPWSEQRTPYLPPRALPPRSPHKTCTDNILLIYLPFFSVFLCVQPPRSTSRECAVVASNAHYVVAPRGVDLLMVLMAFQRALLIKLQQRRVSRSPGRGPGSPTPPPGHGLHWSNDCLFRNFLFRCPKMIGHFYTTNSRI